MNYAELNVNAALGLAYQRSGIAGSIPAPVVVPVVPNPPVVPVVAEVVPTSVPTPASPPPVQTNPDTPFTGTPFSTGQTIPAEQFDRGGEGISFYSPFVLNAAAETSGPAPSIWRGRERTAELGCSPRRNRVNGSITRCMSAHPATTI